MSSTSTILRLLGASRGSAGVRLGVCPACHSTVFSSDRHARYRGDVWHVAPCVEWSGARAAVRYHPDVETVREALRVAKARGE